MKTSFWTYFTSGYGMIWMILLGCAFVCQTHLDAGAFGLFGFPLIAAFYAWIRCSKDTETVAKQQSQVLSPQLGEFLAAHPEYLNVPHHLRNHAFQTWLKCEDNP